MADATRIAQRLLTLGLSIIPIKMPGKAPVGPWKEFQGRLPRPDELHYNGSIALVCGKVSGNVEVIDVDVKNDSTGKLIEKLLAALNNACPEVIKKLVVQVTLSKGLHFVYRCSEIERNQILARGKDRKAIIETRGEGGYAVIAPTPGYEITDGSLESINEIRPADRLELLDTCRALNEYFEPVRLAKLDDVYESELTPWADYNKHGDIQELLQSHGWKLSHAQGEYQYFTRPNKPAGISGSWNGSLFYCFTSSTILEPSKAYSLTALRTHLEFNGDFSECAKRLYSLGFGRRSNSQSTLTYQNKMTPTEGPKPFKSYIVKEVPANEPGILSLNGVNILDHHNILLLTGPLKGRKTMCACALVNQSGCKTAYIDTEQGLKHSWRTGQFTPNADVFHMRGEGHVEIFRVISECVDSGEYQLMVIDNVRDLIQDFNNVDQSGALELYLKKISKRIPVIAILHENKNNQKGQGHLGYGVSKIAQTTIRVYLVNAKDPGKGSYVECVHSRDEPFKRSFISKEGELSCENLVKAGGKTLPLEEFLRLLGDIEYSRNELNEKVAEFFGIEKSSAGNVMTTIRRAYPNAISERKDGKKKFFFVSRATK